MARGPDRISAPSRASGVRYMRSDIDTLLERSEISSASAAARFDVLIGIQPAAEGLDYPRMRAGWRFLDCDKEFPAPETSLIQNHLRRAAAQTTSTQVILYADKITGSMSGRWRKPSRRRASRPSTTPAHAFTPESSRRTISDISMSVLRARPLFAPRSAAPGGRGGGGRRGRAGRRHLKGASRSAGKADCRDSAADLDFRNRRPACATEVQAAGKAVELDLMDDPLARNAASENTKASRKATPPASPQNAGPSKRQIHIPGRNPESSYFRKETIRRMTVRRPHQRKTGAGRTPKKPDDPISTAARLGAGQLRGPGPKPRANKRRPGKTGDRDGRGVSPFPWWESDKKIMILLQPSHRF